MACDRYLELLSARLDGALTEAEERELEGHLAACPDYRAVGAQLSALQEAFPELEEAGTAPEGFARGVMDRIRAEEPKKVIPLFKRPQVRALAGLAACLALVVGLYGASRPRSLGETVKMEMEVRSFSQDAQVESEENPQVNASPADPELAAAPQIAAYAAPEADASAGTVGMAPNSTADGLGGGERKVVPDMAYAEAVLTLERMPEGGWELIPPETPVSPDGLTVSAELMEQLEQLALEQGISVSLESGPEDNDHCLIIILDAAE